MHNNQLKWLRDVKHEFPEHFKNAAVLELGSRHWEGPRVRDLFENCVYVGVDCLPGDGVDVVCDARTYNPAHDRPTDELLDCEVDDLGLFDTLVCLSVFEHEPHWPCLLWNNLRWLKPGDLSLVLLSWGAEGNQHHAPEPWKPVTTDEFWTLTEPMLLAGHDFFFEEDRYGPECPGCFNFVGSL